MQAMNPTSIQTSNGTVDLFTGIFYIIRILGIGQGVVQPSPTQSPNGGFYLEQNIFATQEDEAHSDSLWFFEDSTTPEFYEWGSRSQPNARVAWASGGTEKDDYPLELRNISDATEEIYQDPTSSYWEFQPYDLAPLGYLGTGYKIKPLNIQNSETMASATFATSPKSPQGWWLQVNQHDETDREMQNQNRKDVNRYTADYLFVLEPSHFKLYAEIAHMNIGDEDTIARLRRVKEYVAVDRLLENPSENDVSENVTIQGAAFYNLDVNLDKKFDMFAGITVLSPNTIPNREYFDMEKEKRADDWSLNLRAYTRVTTTEEIDLEPFSKKNVSGYVTYFKEFHGLRYYSYADVTAVADMMGRHGQVMRNVLVTDVKLLKHLIKSKGYDGEFFEVVQEQDCAKVRVKVEGVVRGNYPLPFIQVEEGASKHVSQFEQDYKRGNMAHLS